MRNIVRNLIIAGAAATALTMAAAPASAATCLNKLIHTATGTYALGFDKARGRAIANWSKWAKTNYGQQYGSWRLAKNKSLSCATNISSKVPIQTCTASATPCSF